MPFSVILLLTDINLPDFSLPKGSTLFLTKEFEMNDDGIICGGGIINKSEFYWSK